MKIAFLGNFSVNYTSESHYMRTLRKMGHEVIIYQEGHPINKDELGFILECDIFFWVHTHGWKTENLDYILEKVKEFKIPVVGYHLDLWLGIEREKDLLDDEYWKQMDFFFCTDKLMVNWLNEREGYPKAFYLPAGVFEDECEVGNQKPEFTHDIVFTGSRGHHKEWPYRQKLINWLEKTYGSRFKHYDHGHEPKMRGQNLNDLYASSKIIIGDTLCKDFNYPYYLSDRIFEVTGRGGFIIHPFIKGIDELFNLPEKKELHYDTSKAEIITYPFNNFKYLKYLIDYYLVNNEERESIRMRGHERTKKDHTYTQRLSTMLETVVNN